MRWAIWNFLNFWNFALENFQTWNFEVSFKDKKVQLILNFKVINCFLQSLILLNIVSIKVWFYQSLI